MTLKSKTRIFATWILVLAAIVLAAFIPPATSAYRTIEDQFAATMFIHIVTVLPKQMQELIARYQKDIWDGYKFEGNFVIERRNEEGPSGYMCFREIDDKQATLVDWLKNYKEGADSTNAQGNQIPRNMSRIMYEHGRLWRNIEQVFREQPNINAGAVMEKIYNSDLTVSYNGFVKSDKISDLIKQNVMILRRNSTPTPALFYQCLLSSCVNSLVNVHIMAGRPVDVASIQPRNFKFSNKMTSRGGRSSASKYCNLLFSVCMYQCEAYGQTDCDSTCEQVYDYCGD